MSDQMRLKGRPHIGEKWCLRAKPHCIATVVSVDLGGIFGGYVRAKTPWTKHGETGHSLDTWGKSYRRVTHQQSTTLKD